MCVASQDDTSWSLYNTWNNIWLEKTYGYWDRLNQTYDYSMIQIHWPLHTPARLLLKWHWAALEDCTIWSVLLIKLSSKCAEQMLLNLVGLKPSRHKLTRHLRCCSGAVVTSGSLKWHRGGIQYEMNRNWWLKMKDELWFVLKDGDPIHRHSRSQLRKACGQTHRNINS